MERCKLGKRRTMPGLKVHGGSLCDDTDCIPGHSCFASGASHRSPRPEMSAVPSSRVKRRVRRTAKDVGRLRPPAAAGMRFHEAHESLNRFLFIRMVEDAEVGCSITLGIDVDDVLQSVCRDVIQQFKNEIAVRINDHDSDVVSDGFDDHISQ